MTPSVIQPPLGWAVMSTLPEAGTVMLNQISFEEAENPPMAAPLPPVHVEGVGAPKEAVAPTVVKDEKLQVEVTVGSWMAVHGSSLVGVGVGVPVIQIGR